MTHGQTVRQFREWCEFAGLRPDDRYLIVNPFFHMFGYKAGWLASLLQGATIVPVPVFDVAQVLSLVESGADHGVARRSDDLPLDPRPSRSRAFDLHTLRVAVTGAADIPVALIEEMRAELPFRSILTGYGLTEAGHVHGIAARRRRGDDRHDGRPRDGRSRDHHRRRATGRRSSGARPGELLVRGYSVMQGYLDDPEATAAAIDDRGFLHTGDLATMDDRGYVRIVGRSKDMLIVGGFNVYPAEVENTLLAHDAIGQVAVIGVPDERMGEVADGVRRSRRGTVGRSRRDHRLGARAPRQLQGAAVRRRRRGAADQRHRQGREGRAPRPRGGRPERR